MNWRACVFGVLSFVGAVSCSSPIDPAGGASVTTGNGLSPANGALIAHSAQPVTLRIKNGFVTDPGVAVSYLFQVASDPAFANVVQSRDVAQTPEQTSSTLDVLTAGRDYFWRVRTTAGDTVGEFTAPLRFTIGPGA
jgi:hypothetical protein